MKTAQKISPKVILAAVVGFLVTALTAGVADLNPDAFDALGVWGPVAQAAVVAGSAWLAGWLKTDPLRVVGAEAIEAKIAEVAPEEAPSVVGDTVKESPTEGKYEPPAWQVPEKK